MPYYLSPPPQSPLVRIVAGIFAIVTLVGALMIGMVALLVVAGVGVIAGVAIWLRVAWIKRKMRKAGVDLSGQTVGSNTRQSSDSGQIIEAEYTVISENEDKNENAR